VGRQRLERAGQHGHGPAPYGDHRATSEFAHAILQRDCSHTQARCRCQSQRFWRRISPPPHRPGMASSDGEFPGYRPQRTPARYYSDSRSPPALSRAQCERPTATRHYEEIGRQVLAIVYAERGQHHDIGKAHPGDGVVAALGAPAAAVLLLRRRTRHRSPIKMKAGTAAQ
jgi:hypothetical protein